MLAKQFMKGKCKNVKSVMTYYSGKINASSSVEMSNESDGTIHI